VTREGLEPSRLGGHGLLRTACLPFHHLAIDEQWTVEGVEPSSAGCRPTVFPLDDTPRIKSSGLAGNRTLNLDFKRVLLCQLSYKAIRIVCPVGGEPQHPSFSKRVVCRLPTGPQSSTAVSKDHGGCQALLPPDRRLSQSTKKARGRVTPGLQGSHPERVGVTVAEGRQPALSAGN
jgi:hypothetical protein